MLSCLKMPSQFDGHFLFPLSSNKKGGEGRVRGLPSWLSGKESTCQCKRHRRGRFDPWVGKIPWRREWLPTLVFLPGKFYGQRRLVGYIQSMGSHRVGYDLVIKHTHKDSILEIYT